MKKILALFALILLIGCAKKDTFLDITITEHPEGGANVPSLSCEFEGDLTGGDESITATVEWWWEDSNHENDQVIDSETYTFSSQSTVSHTTTITAASLGGDILLNYWWVRISWENEDGSDEEVESNQVYCYFQQ